MSRLRTSTKVQIKNHSHNFREIENFRILTPNGPREILMGARHLLPNVKAIIVETSLIRTNIGAPRIESVCDFLIDQDFKPVSISEVHNRGGILNQIDLVFYHKSLNYP